MPAKFKPQFKRLMALDRELRKGGRVNARRLLALPEYQEMSRKTVLRDIEYLRYQLEAPIEYDASRKSYYYTSREYFLPAVPLEESDFFSILIAEKVLEQYENTPLYDRLRATFEKLGDLLPGRVSVAPGAVGCRYSFFFPPRSFLDPAVWDELSRGLSADRTVRLAYRAAGADAPKTRDIDPYVLASYGGAWYVIGRCHTAGDVRTFALSRVEQARVLDRGFDLPEGFDPETMMGRHFGIVWGEEEHEVRLRFAARHAVYVLERAWHPTQELRQRSDGSVEMTLRVNALVELRRWILSWGEGVEVISPPELRERVHAEARGLARDNRPPGPGA